jgi:hypothetical protein
VIGLFPTLGSLLKGCFKILFAYGRKAAFNAVTPIAEGLWHISKPLVEKAITKLKEFMARPMVRKAMSALHWDNPFKKLAEMLRKLIDEINVDSLLKAMDSVINALQKLVSLVQKWGSAAMSTKAGELLQKVVYVRNAANAGFAKWAKPGQEWLDHLARRLDIEADNSYRGFLKVVNDHGLVKPTNLEEIAAFQKAKPGWVDKTTNVPHRPENKAPFKADWPDLRDTAKGPTKTKYDTFEKGKIKDVTIPPGETLYRVVDPGSGDNNICWMRKAEFDKLKSKDDWRRKFAVWTNWNANGEYVTYTVPPGKGLNVWEGVVGTQEHELDRLYKLEGGAIQIVLDPSTLKKEFLGKRQATNWGYSSFGESIGLLGVPTLKNNWYGK